MRRTVLCLAIAFGTCSPRAQDLSPANLSTAAGPARVSPQRFEFKEGDRIVFLGDPLMAGDQKDGYIETMLTSRLEGKKAIFRNLAWSADTVPGCSRGSFDRPEKALKRLKEQLHAFKPTVAFLAYGTAEAFNGNAGVKKFKRDIKTLMDTITKTSNPEPVRFVIVTPLYQEALASPLPDPPAHNAQ